MIRINLLPVRATRKKETAKRQALLAAIGLAVLVAIIAAVQISYMTRISSLETSNAQLKKDIEDLKKIIGQVDETKAKKADLEKKLGIIKVLKANKTGPVHMLDEINKAIPERIWLTGVTQKGTSVNMTGQATSLENVGDFMAALDKSRYFNNTILVSTKAQAPKGGKKATNEVRLKNFSVTTELISPELKDKKEAEKRKLLPGGGGNVPPGQAPDAPAQTAPAAPSAPAAAPGNG